MASPPCPPPPPLAPGPRVRYPLTAVCVYCKHDGRSVPARWTCHDPRGCLAVCDEHARWRMTTSMGLGHGSECAERGEGVVLARA